MDSPSDIEGIISAASKRKILVLLDETFIEFAGEKNSFTYRIHEFENLFICRTFTKFFGVPGLRVGYGIGTPEIIDIIRKGQNLWPVNCAGQVVARAILRNSEVAKKSISFYECERHDMVTRLKEIPGLTVYPSNTNYLLLNTRVLGITAMELKQELLEKGFLIRDCSNYPGLNEYHVRIAIKAPDKNSRLLDALQKMIGKR